MTLFTLSSRTFNIFSLSLFILFALAQNAHSQVSNSSEIFTELAKADSLLFEAGFNNCEIPVVENLLHTDLEFYHDLGGIENRTEFLQGFKRNICSSPESKPIRKLVPGSLEVYTLTDDGELYGALQKGEHRFYIRETDREPYYTTSAQFTSVWILEEDEWKLKTVLSYDHGKK